MRIRIPKLLDLTLSILDPRSYLHMIRLLHYHSYSHARQRGRIDIGRGSRVAPNVSFRNGERISLGNDCHVGDHCYLWAGDSSGCITVGDSVSLAPGVFITASDYQFVAGLPFRSQPRKERDVIIGSDVWLGAQVVVTAGVSIGAGCIVGAGAVVTKDLPPGSIAVGVPARVVRVRDENESVSPNHEKIECRNHHRFL